MINVIIFSKDRAAQLRLLIESISINTHKLFDKVAVIYTASTEEFAEGYNLLQKEKILPSRIKIDWVQQVNLAEDTTKMIGRYQGQETFISFLTDDSVFYRTAHDYKFAIESSLHKASDIACFTLRMGLNTAEQIYWSRGNKAKLIYTQVNNIIKWRHMDYPITHNYGYPTSLDGHIFRAERMLELTREVGEFQNVNALEGCLCRFKNELPPCMASFEQSVLVTVPINKVQTVVNNNAGMFYGISVEELNNRYLTGQVIDYHNIDFSNITGTHQELRYTFRRLI